MCGRNSAFKSLAVMLVWMNSIGSIAQVPMQELDNPFVGGDLKSVQSKMSLFPGEIVGVPNIVSESIDHSGALSNSAHLHGSNRASYSIIDAAGGLIVSNPSIVADTDNDGIADSEDAFPFDPNENSDSDLDGVGNNADTDDDNDGVLDINDLFPTNPARTKPIISAFPNENGITDFPDHAAGNQLEWVLQEINAGPTTLSEIQEHFTTAFNQPGLVTFFEQLRDLFPNSQVLEPVSVTAGQAIIIAGNPDIPTSNGAFIDLRIDLVSGKINYFLVQNSTQTPSSTAPGDALLTLEQSANKIESLADQTAVLIARIDGGNQCVPSFARNQNDALTLGSIFKAWLLGGVAQAIEEGVISPAQQVALIADEISPVGESLSTAPLGTLFSIKDLGNMMMGISDNSATDHLLNELGRVRAEAALVQLGHSNADLMTPFLSTNEAFHLYWSLPETQALTFVNGTEPQQREFLTNIIEPLGPVTSFPFANGSILLDGTWRASPMDICQAIAGLRQYNDTTEAFEFIDQAYSANAGFWAQRQRWERVWFKGGSLADGQGLMALTGGWLVESDDRGAFVVIGMANTPSSSATRIDSGQFFSTMSRIMDIVNLTN